MNQFNVWNNVSVGSDYDYTSIMHYDNCAFAISTSCTSTTYDLQTIVPKPCHLDIVGGDPISTLDFDGIRKLYAPALQAVLVNERAPSCGALEYRPEQFQQVCGPNCKLSPTTDFRKKEEVYQNWCGMMARLPDGYEQSRCVPLKKDYVTSWWDHDDFSCGRLNLETLHELWVQCGCAFVSAASLCTNINAFSVGSYQEKPKWPDWRAGRVVDFNNIVRELSVDKLLQQDILDKLGTFYQKNYLDLRFETKLSRVRAGMYAYARWKRSIDPQYSMPEDFFKKIVSRHRLKWSS